MPMPSNISADGAQPMSKRLSLCLTPDQHHQIATDASNTGLSRSSYARTKLFAATTLRFIRRPFIEQKELAQFLAHLGRLAGSLHQISSALNSAAPHDQRKKLKQT